MTEILLGMLLAHLVADFTLQFDWIAENKHDNNHVFAAHIAVHTFAVYFFLIMLSPGPTTALIGVLYVISHAAIDSYQPRPKINIDQTAHLVSILLIYAGSVIL